MRKNKLILLLVFLFAEKLICAQNPVDLLKQTTRAYLEADNLSADVRVHTYASVEDKGVLLGNGLIRKSGANYYSKFMNDELIVNGKCTLVLDHDAKTIAWYKADDDKKAWKKTAEHLPDVDSLYAVGDSLVYKGVNNGMRNFLLYSRDPNSAIRLTELFIDDQTHFINRIVYYYHDNTPDDQYDIYKVVIEYVSISTTTPPENYFSEKKYISYAKGIPVLNSSYSSYKLFIEK